MRSWKWFFILFFLFNACKKEANQQATQESKGEKTSPCTYTLIQDSLKVQWFAYKTTEKVEVGGTFDEVILLANISSNSLISLIQNARVSIPVNSVNTNNPDRDAKIKEHFFGKMEGTDTLYILVTKVEGNDREGIISANLRMNNMEKGIQLPYRYNEEGYLTAETEIDLTKWYVQKAIEALNQACYDLHKGPDGVSKLWETVKIRLIALIKKDCKTDTPS